MNKLWLFLLLCAGNVTWCRAGDSTGVKLIDQKVYVKYKLSEKEGLQDLGKKYQCSVYDLSKANNIKADAKLTAGQILLVPRPQLNVMLRKYKVKKGDTMLAFALRYKTNYQLIKQLNDLSSENVRFDQEIYLLSNMLSPDLQIIHKFADKMHQVGAGETLFKIATMYKTKTDSIQKWNNLPQGQVNLDQKLVVARYYAGGKYTDAGPVKLTGESVTENGLGSKFYLGNDEMVGLHRSLPVGTTVKVYHKSSKVNVNVKIIGQLPDTPENRKIVIKVSDAVADKLGYINDEFPVVITYIAPPKKSEDELE